MNAGEDTGYREHGRIAAGEGEEEQHCTVAARCCMLAVAFYRRFISPLKGPCCRFEPTCSAYAAEAFRRHGFWRGMGLTLCRIARCHPFYHGNLNDPVPPSRPENPDRRLQ